VFVQKEQVYVSEHGHACVLLNAHVGVKNDRLSLGDTIMDDHRCLYKHRSET